MRKLAFVLCLFASLPLFAQQEKENSVYVFLTNPSFGWSDSSGTFYHGAYGVGLLHRFGSRWSGELAVSRQLDRSGFTRYDPNGNIIERRMFTTTTTPVDLSAHYHFFTASAWKPYAGVTVRRTDDERDPYLAGVTGGVLWKIRPTFGIRFDGKLLLGDRPAYVDRVNASVGAAFSF